MTTNEVVQWIMAALNVWWIAKIMIGLVQYPVKKQKRHGVWTQDDQRTKVK